MSMFTTCGFCGGTLDPSGNCHSRRCGSKRIKVCDITNCSTVKAAEQQMDEKEIQLTAKTNKINRLLVGLEKIATFKTMPCSGTKAYSMREIARKLLAESI